MILYSANIIGAPAGWARAGACVRAGHAAIYEKDTGPSATWRGMLLLHFARTRPTTPFAVPVQVYMAFRFARPKSHFGARGLKPSAPRYHTVKPDLDNCVKLVLDAMAQKGCPLILADDRIVWKMRPEKRWCSDGESPGCEVEVES